MTRAYLIAFLAAILLATAEQLPTNRHSHMCLELPGYVAISLDSPPAGQSQEESEAEQKALQKAELRRRELTSDCICPQSLRDSITFEQIQAAFYANYYDTLQLDPTIVYAANPYIETARREEERRRRRVQKIHQTPGLYEQLRAKQKTLKSIKDQICCLIKFAKQDMGRSSVGEEIEDMRTHPTMKKYGELQAKINKNMAILSVDLEEYREARGKQAMQVLKELEKQFNDLRGRTEGYSNDSIVKALRQPANMLAIQQLKNYIFMSNTLPNINCNSGVGQWLKGLPPERTSDIDPKSDCIGYAVALGKNHNLLILRVRGTSLQDNKTIERVVAVVWRKVREQRRPGENPQKAHEPIADIGAVDLL
ncbi:MAG: hypothetical protein RMJ87_07780 [Cytophagales bacterium]|nr:hypothetical protein [Bernardetiaceae bacterium]MDW8204911.1 hypothetical protein [Cytophagales bacterium]